ncbi:MAG: hypothetical protein GY866_04665 [Proteobacteria bacterium]|nr:hypothetical protein [Pseudomonadota bacterium]
MSEHELELAVQLRHPSLPDGHKSIADHLASLYADAGLAEVGVEGEDGHRTSRIYVGDEFCALRLPRLQELKAFIALARDHNLALTLLTPVMTDDDLNRCEPLLDYLSEHASKTEVVVNDPGSIEWLRVSYPSLPVSAGRLFNKGLKDPRISNPSVAVSDSNHQELFDRKVILDMLGGLGVARLERDVFPSGNLDFGACSDLGLSVYFPFGYFTTGRVCWVSTFENGNKSKYIPNRHCGKPCENSTFELKSSEFSLPVIQGGNTLFYCYQPSTLTTLIQKAAVEKMRLVYQGYAI